MSNINMTSHAELSCAFKIPPNAYVRIKVLSSDGVCDLLALEISARGKDHEEVVDVIERTRKVLIKALLDD